MSVFTKDFVAVFLMYASCSSRIIIMLSINFDDYLSLFLFQQLVPVGSHRAKGGL
jgi:hypothetical protein